MKARIHLLSLAVGLVLVLILTGSVAAQRPTATLTGTVSHGITDEPIAGIEVTLASAANRVDTIIAPFAADAIVRYYAETNEDGSYSFADVPPGDYVIFAEDEDHATLPAITLVLDEGETQNVNFSMTEGGSITGTVLNSDGNPATGGVVSLFNMRLSIDATEIRSDGTYLFPHVEPGEQYQLFFQTADEAKLSEDQLVVTEGEALEIDMTMDPAVQIVGYVTDDLGNPIEMAVVSLEGEDLRWSGITDETGRYVLGGSGAEYITIIPETYDLRVRAIHHDNYFEADLDLTEPSVREMNFTLNRAYIVSGMVVDDRSLPVVNATVSAIGPSGREYTTLTEEDGSYLLDILDDSQEYLIRAFVDDHVPQTYGVVSGEMGTETSGVNFTLPRGTFFYGTVFDPAGEVAENTLMDVYTPEGDVVSLVTDFEGNFEYDGFASGNYTVVVPDQGSGFGYIGTLTVGDTYEPFVLNTAETVEITGTTTDADLVVVMFGTTPLAVIPVEDDGTFTYSGLAPGMYRFMTYTGTVAGAPVEVEVLGDGTNVNLSVE